MKVKMKSKFVTLLIVVLVLGVLVAGTVFAATDNDFEVGAENLNNTAQNSAKVGDQLLKPEKGWKRYQDSNTNITYVGNWRVGPAAVYSGGSRHQSIDEPETTKIKFNFTGTKLILISSITGSYSNKIEIKIDNNKVEYFSQQSQDKLTNQGVCYKVENLQNIEHSAEITLIEKEPYPTSCDINLDAIDIDVNGEFKAIKQDVKVSSLELNKSILDLFVGQDETLVATVKPDNATNKALKWTSSDTSIATVDQNGKVVGVKSGKVTITATTQDGSNLSKSCEVTVKEIDAGNGVLKIKMVTNDVYEYDVPVSEINKFIEWMKQKGSGDPFYKFSKAPTVGNIESRTEYLMYNQIVNFTVDKYK